MPRQNTAAFGSPSPASSSSAVPPRNTPALRLAPADDGGLPTAARLREARSLGADMLVAGNLEAALTAFQEAARLAPEEPACRQKVAEVLQRLGRTRDATAEYEAAARAWQRLGWTPRAVALCKVILQFDPVHGRAHALLAELRGHRGRPLPGAKADPRATPEAPAPQRALPVTAPSGAPVQEQPPDAVSHLMRGSPFFSGLRQPLLQTVRDAFTPCTVDAGEQILHRGQAAHALYVLLRGRCTVFHQHVDGHETHYPGLVAGDVFGEVSLLRSKLVTASVRAATPCLLLRLERGAFEQLLDAEPELRRALQRMGAERLWRTTLLLAGRAPRAPPQEEPRQAG